MNELNQYQHRPAVYESQMPFFCSPCMKNRQPFEKAIHNYVQVRSSDCLKHRPYRPITLRRVRPAALFGQGGANALSAKTTPKKADPRRAPGRSPPPSNPGEADGQKQQSAQAVYSRADVADGVALWTSNFYTKTIQFIYQPSKLQNEDKSASF